MGGNAQLMNSSDNIQALPLKAHKQKTRMTRSIKQDGIRNIEGYTHTKKNVRLCQTLGQNCGDNSGVLEFMGHMKERYMTQANVYRKFVVENVGKA